MKLHLTSALTLAIAVLIAFGTLTPPGPPGPPLPFTDKQMHFMAFALLVMPLIWVKPRYVLWLAPLALIYGGVIELLQPFVGRSADWLDLLADSGGILAGLLPGFVRSKLRKTQRG